MHRGQSVVVTKDLVGDIPAGLIGSTGRVIGRHHLSDDFSTGDRAYEVEIEGWERTFVFWETELAA